jgi:hypothetical protein
VAYEQKPNTGTLFKNDQKNSDKHPSYKGSAVIDGTDYWVSLWKNTSEKTGEPILKLAFEKKQPRGSDGGNKHPNRSDDDF